MDFDRELKNFAHSDVPLRQLREEAHWALDVRIGHLRLCADARDLSRGGIGASLPAVMVGDLMTGQEVVLSIVWPEDMGGVSDVPARVAWVKKNNGVVLVGFAFYGISEADAACIDRYLFSKIIQRHIAADS